MKEFLIANWKKILIGVGGLIAVVLLFNISMYLYKNSYAQERYHYTNKSVQNQTFDQNVTIDKKMKRNATAGEIKFNFEKKDLSEEYEILLDKKISPYSVEVSVIGKINAGSMNVRLADDANNVYFQEDVKGNNIKQVSTSDTSAKRYRLIVTPNGAQNGEIAVSYRMYY